MKRVIGPAVVATLLLGCSQSTEQPPMPPLHLGVAYDVSASAQPLPELTMEHIQQLLKVLNARGGSIAVALVDESGFQPLTRLKIETVVGRLDERAHLYTKNQERAKDFLAKVEGLLTRPRNARRTDILGTVARLRLFFSEPNIQAGAEKVLLFISDGVDTVHRQGTPSLPDDVAVYVVGMEAGVADRLFHGRGVLFESPHAAIEQLESIRR
jgi:hypothetical protein